MEVRTLGGFDDFENESEFHKAIYPGERLDPKLLTAEIKKIGNFRGVRGTAGAPWLLCPSAFLRNKSLTG